MPNIDIYTPLRNAREEAHHVDFIAEFRRGGCEFLGTFIHVFVSLVPLVVSDLTKVDAWEAGKLKKLFIISFEN